MNTQDIIDRVCNTYTICNTYFRDYYDTPRTDYIFHEVGIKIDFHLKMLAVGIDSVMPGSPMSDILADFNFINNDQFDIISMDGNYCDLRVEGYRLSDDHERIFGSWSFDQDALITVTSHRDHLITVTMRFRMEDRVRSIIEGIIERRKPVELTEDELYEQEMMVLMAHDEDFITRD